MEEHREHVKAILQRLREHQLYAKHEKCEFHQSTAEFLGFILSPQGVTMDKRKVEAILDWPSPTSVKEIQTILGFANFYRRFIEGFAQKVHPITRLLKKGVHSNGTQQWKKAFRYSKRHLLQLRYYCIPTLLNSSSWKPTHPVMLLGLSFRSEMTMGNHTQ
ncbi:uncharacterized protein [Ambystoma mexicanum]|uniref:uncharacterized protein n=1 Tax=Ambystoma mexicanum TaxID=8296 RepID=UPI0037E8389C